MIGQRHNRLTVVAPVLEIPAGRTAKWLCRCDCGNKTVVERQKLLKGHTGSCGCLSRELTSKRARKHGKWETSEWSTWSAMKKRCNAPTAINYHLYGGRGITVCQEWMNSFEAFFAHVGQKPSPSHSIDRIDNNGDYEPGNVRWATPKEQRANSRQKSRKP
jgi:hypothetical protein